MIKPNLHPACAEWPKLSGEALNELAVDIGQRGLLEPITLTREGEILDGSNRWDACEIAGITQQTTVYEGNDSIGFVVAKNKHRRHMEQQGLAIVVAKLMNLKPGGIGGSTVVLGENNAYSCKDAVRDSGLSRSTIENARTVLNEGADNVIDMARTGKVALRTARDAVKGYSKEDQATWTAEDVKKKGRAVMEAHPSSKKRKAVKSSSNGLPKGKLPGIEPIKFPSAEETGLPINGTLEEKDAHHKKYGRTPVHAKVVADMINNHSWVDSYVISVTNVSSDRHPNPDQFFTAVEQMLAWKPQPEKGQDWAINFAVKAKKQLALLQERLPIALERLNNLYHALTSRNEILA